MVNWQWLIAAFAAGLATYPLVAHYCGIWLGKLLAEQD